MPSFANRRVLVTGASGFIGSHLSPRADLEHLCARIDRAAALLEWRPTTSLAEGLRRIVAWNRRRLEQTGRCGELAGQSHD